MYQLVDELNDGVQYGIIPVGSAGTEREQQREVSRLRYRVANGQAMGERGDGGQNQQRWGGIVVEN